MSRTGYARLSNELWRNTKIRKLKRKHGMSPVGLFALIVTYCSDTMSDGRISEDALLYQLDADDTDVQALVEAGMLTADGDGYVVHDYLRHQNSREQIEQQAEAHRRRQREYLERRAVAKDQEACDASLTRHIDVNDGATVNQEPRTNNQASSSQVVEEVGKSTRVHAREVASPAAGEESDDEGMIGAWEPCGEDYELARRLHAQGKPLVDVDALAARYRDKLVSRGFEECGVRRHTPAALQAGFRMWVSREAEWRAHDPKPTHTPPRVEPKPNAHSWSDVTVRHLMAPYRSMFPAAGEVGRGPSRPWYDACERVARMLNDGMGEQEVAARLADEYDNQNTENEINDP